MRVNDFKVKNSGEHQDLSGRYGTMEGEKSLKTEGVNRIE